jgi:hypothetical protein
MTDKAPTPTNNAGDQNVVSYFSLQSGTGDGAVAYFMKAKTGSYQAETYKHLSVAASNDPPNTGVAANRKTLLRNGVIANVILILAPARTNGPAGRAIVSVPLAKLEEVLKQGGPLSGRKVGKSNRTISDVRPCTK